MIIIVKRTCYPRDDHFSLMLLGPRTGWECCMPIVLWFTAFYNSQSTVLLLSQFNTLSFSKTLAYQQGSADLWKTCCKRDGKTAHLKRPWWTSGTVFLNKYSYMKFSPEEKRKRGKRGGEGRGGDLEIGVLGLRSWLLLHPHKNLERGLDSRHDSRTSVLREPVLALALDFNWAKDPGGIGVLRCW